MIKFLRILIIVMMLGENAMANDILTPKEQVIARVSAYAALGDQKNLAQAIVDGLELDITVNEFKEILVQAYAYCGFPRSLNALNTLMEIVEKQGENVKLGNEPTSLLQQNSLEVGHRNQTKLVGNEVSGKLFDFAPAIDRYLKAHLFGDIFAHDNLDWKTRELATIAMLATQEGVESQLAAHINIGKYNGLTEQQIANIISLASAAKADKVIFGKGPENPYAKYFTGKSYLQPITTTNGVPMFNVTFEPKCRNNWHIHHRGGQILLVTSGRGYYQEWNKPARELKPGDVVNIPAEVKHWHGAAKDSWFTHIAIEVPSQGGSTEWGERVSDEEYEKLK